jgi:hypothetical protein
MLAALALALSAQAQTGPAGTWRALTLPRLCQEVPAAPEFEALWSGRHLSLREGSEESPRFGQPAHLPLAALVGLLGEDGARARRSLRVEPGGPPLLVRGSPAEIEAAQALCAELDLQGRALEIELAAWLTPGVPRVGTHPARQVFEAAVQDVEPLGRARVRSGGSAALGVRGGREFLAGYEVQVATGSSVAGPVLGRVREGRTLHLRAARARGGRTLVLEGLLDLCELLSLEDFDPGTRDLGLVQLPRAAVVQVAFAGAIESGGVLAVQLSGTGLGEPDWTLWIEARGSPDAPGRWRACDLALLEGPALDLPWPQPGGDLLDGAPTRAGRTLLQGVSAAAVAQAADEAHGAGGRSPIVWSGGLVLAPAGEAALWSEVDALVAAAESEHLRAATLRVRHAGLEVTLPLLEGRPARVLVGVERARLTGYELQVAQDTWMPDPRVESVFDGLLLQGHLEQGRLLGGAWRASSEPERVLERAQASLARLPIGARHLERGTLALELGAGAAAALPGSGDRPALEAALEPPPSGT